MIHYLFDPEFYTESQVLDVKSNKYKLVDYHFVKKFSKSTDSFQYDIETDMVKDSPRAYWERTIKTLQFGTEDQDQLVIPLQAVKLDMIKPYLKHMLEDCTILAHNARFEYCMTKIHLGYIIENIEDTMLMSRILNGGLEFDYPYHSLENCAQRWCNVSMDKKCQKTFGDNFPFTPGQVLYAAGDVSPLHMMYNKLKHKLETWDLFRVYDHTEKHFLKVMGDMETDHMGFDSEYWREMGEEFKVLTAQENERLNLSILGDPALFMYCIRESPKVLKKELIQTKDEITISWAGKKDKVVVFNHFNPGFDFSPYTTKPKLKKYFLSVKDQLTDEGRKVIQWYLDRKYDVLNGFLLGYKEFLLDNKFFVAAGTVNINWNSNPDKLFVFNFFVPELQAVNEKALSGITTVPIIQEYKKYTKVQKFNSTYGLSFIDKYAFDQDKIAPSGGNQILDTGRLSFGIMLTMPSKDSRASKLRAGFLPPYKDWVLAATDYASAELILMAKLAGEQVILDAVKKGLDIHSLSASSMFPDDWIGMAEPGCEHLKSGKRCKCKEHNKFRSYSKSISFGCAYGISAVGLSETLGVTQERAQDLIDRFFLAFPSLNALFENSAKEGRENLYVRGAYPAGRIRFYHAPEDGSFGAIERQSKNYKIQNANAEMTKSACVKLRTEIIKRKLPVKLHIPIHDSEKYLYLSC